jgi:hypothetical protein
VIAAGEINHRYVGSSRFVAFARRGRWIEELTGRDVSCLDDQVDFFLALPIR